MRSSSPAKSETAIMSDKMDRSAASRTDSDSAFLGELGDLVGCPGSALGHPADGPIEGAAAIRLDLGPDLGLAGPAVGRPLGHVVGARPLGDGFALRHRERRALLLRLVRVFSGHGAHWHAMARSTAPPFGPARGSQPGAQAGRHALEGQAMVTASRTQRVRWRLDVVQNQRFSGPNARQFAPDGQARRKTRRKSSKT